MLSSYLTVPIREDYTKYMGAHWPGDAFTKDITNILAKCVVHAMEGTFKQVCEHLTLVERNGIVLSPTKFVFAMDTADFAAFIITPDSVRPCEAYLKGVMNFPTPTEITGARSFFGLVNHQAAC